jgi:hypothetical protein
VVTRLRSQFYLAFIGAIILGAVYGARWLGLVKF